MSALAPFATASEIADAVKSGTVTARTVIEAALTRAHQSNPTINAFSAVLAERALASADAVDAGPKGPLAGVPFAVKNLCDLTGETTLAGAKITASDPAATQDADMVQRLEAAGAICIGALHMGEFAYDFTGENAHYGPVRNPHDTSRMTGGSSSGSGAAVAAGVVPLALGSDTNGSLRVPSSLCGVLSLKPTYGRLSRGGTYPFVDSLDHIGPFARTVDDLAATYDAMQAPGPVRDHAIADVPPEFTRAQLAGPPVRVGVPRGFFDECSGEEALARRAEAAAVFGPTVDIDLPGAKAGRAGAYLITNAEAAAFHLERLQPHANEFDRDTRDRLLAGALLPAPWILRAQRVRRWWQDQVLTAFKTANVDVFLVPATPFTAPKIGQDTLTIAGREVPLRPSLGLLAQPFSCIGLPVVTVPVFAPGTLPIGMQLIAPPWKESIALRAAAQLEAAGFTTHPPTA